MVCYYRIDPALFTQHYIIMYSMHNNFMYSIYIYMNYYTQLPDFIPAIQEVHARRSVEFMAVFRVDCVIITFREKYYAQGCSLDVFAFRQKHTTYMISEY